jgi:geranylgeranyl diphosphate synthase, type II
VSGPATFDLDAYLADRRAAVERALEHYLPPATTEPAAVHEAMRYSVFAGGKRLRPVLVIAAAEAAGGQPADVMPTACCLELIHTYSLIHDDLPAMDDDEFRRGRPTSHRVFGEAVAILAGDALLTHGLGLVALNSGLGDTARAALPRILTEIADAAGTPGMIGGQVVDIQSEGKPVSPETLEYIHTHKTGALIRAAVRVGAILVGAGDSVLAALTTYGERIGLAFQIVDDVLDVEGSLASLGKTSGSDRRKQKLTYPSVHGLPASKARAAQLVREAQAALADIGPAGAPLRALAAFVSTRTM